MYRKKIAQTPLPVLEDTRHAARWKLRFKSGEGEKYIWHIEVTAWSYWKQNSNSKLINQVIIKDLLSIFFF